MAGRARSTSHRVFVRPAAPLPLDALDSYFARFGQVTDVYAPKSSSRLVAFVSFLDPEAVERVMASQTHMIAGVRVHAERATPRGGREGGSGHPSPQWPEAQPGMQPPQLVLAAEAVFSGVPPPVSAMHAGQLQAAAREALSRSFPVCFASLAPGPSPMLHVVFDDTDAHGLPVLTLGQQFPIAADIVLTVVSLSGPSRILSADGPHPRHLDVHDDACEWSEGHLATDKAMPLPDFGDAGTGGGIFSGPLRRQSDTQFASRPPPGIAALVHSEGRAASSVRRDSGFCSTANAFSAISEGDARESSAVSVSAVPPTRTSTVSRSRPSVAAGLWDGSAQIVDLIDAPAALRGQAEVEAEEAGKAAEGTSTHASSSKVLIGITRHTHLAQHATPAAAAASEAAAITQGASKDCAGPTRNSALKVASRIVPVPVGHLLLKRTSAGAAGPTVLASCTDSASPRSSEEDEEEDDPTVPAANGAHSGGDSPLPVSVCAAVATTGTGTATPPPPPPPPRPANLGLRVSASGPDDHADADAKESGPTTPSIDHVRSPVGALSPTPGTPVASAHAGASQRDAAAAAARLTVEVEARNGMGQHDSAPHHGSAQTDPSSLPPHAMSSAARRASAPPAPGVAGSCRIFINAVPPHVTEADVVEHFSRFGPVTDVYFPVFHTVVVGGSHGHASSVPTTKRRGFCFVTMAVDADVDTAIAFSDRIIAGCHGLSHHHHHHGAPAAGGIAYGRVTTSSHPGSLGSHMGADAGRSTGMTTSVPPFLAGGFGAPASSSTIFTQEAAGLGSGFDRVAAPASEPMRSSGMHATPAAAHESGSHAAWSKSHGDVAAEADLVDPDVSSPLATAQPPLRMPTGLDSGLAAPSHGGLDGLDDHAGMVAARSAFALLSIEDESSALCPGPIAAGASAVFAQAHGTGFW